MENSEKIYENLILKSLEKIPENGYGKKLKSFREIFEKVSKLENNHPSALVTAANVAFGLDSAQVTVVSWLSMFA